MTKTNCEVEGKDCPDSHLVRFGNTDLFVSRMCQGTAFREHPRARDNKLGLEVLRHCINIGVNFFDSAYGYGDGGSEELLGLAIEGQRDNVIVCTKIAVRYDPANPDKYAPKLPFTRDYLIASTNDALKRLGTDYIDLLLLHSPDYVTPFEEITESMNSLVCSGKTRYWGVSNHPASSVNEIVELGKNSDKAPISAIEDYYNIAGSHMNPKGLSRVRILEQDMFPVLRNSGIGLIAFSPMDTFHLVQDQDPGTPMADLIKVIDEIAAELNVARATVCVAWVSAHSEVTSVLAGSATPQAVEENFAGTNLILPDEAFAKLTAASHTFSDWVVKEGITHDQHR